MGNKPYTPQITIRKRERDGWYHAECPDCGVSILAKTTSTVQKGIRQHGQTTHNWLGIDFYIQ